MDILPFHRYLIKDIGTDLLSIENFNTYTKYNFIYNLLVNPIPFIFNNIMYYYDLFEDKDIFIMRLLENIQNNRYDNVHYTNKVEIIYTIFKLTDDYMEESERFMSESNKANRGAIFEILLKISAIELIDKYLNRYIENPFLDKYITWHYIVNMDIECDISNLLIHHREIFIKYIITESDSNKLDNIFDNLCQNTYGYGGVLLFIDNLINEINIYGSLILSKLCKNETDDAFDIIFKYKDLLNNDCILNLCRNENKYAFEILDNIEMNQNYYEILCTNEHDYAFDIINKYKDIYLDNNNNLYSLCCNNNEKAIDLLYPFLDKLPWDALSSNSNKGAYILLCKNLSKIDFDVLLNENTNIGKYDIIKSFIDNIVNIDNIDNIDYKNNIDDLLESICFKYMDDKYIDTELRDIIIMHKNLLTIDCLKYLSKSTNNLILDIIKDNLVKYPDLYTSLLLNKCKYAISILDNYMDNKRYGYYNYVDDCDEDLYPPYINISYNYDNIKKYYSKLHKELQSLIYNI